jgi:hypothetical protein
MMAGFCLSGFGYGEPASCRLTQSPKAACRPTMWRYQRQPANLRRAFEN